MTNDVARHLMVDFTQMKTFAEDPLEPVRADQQSRPHPRQRCHQRLAQKRGGNLHRVTELPEDLEGGLRLDEETLGLDTALTRLAAVDARLAHVVELRYFAGLSELEIASLLGRSERSIRRDWQKARLFLLASLKDQ